MFDNKNVQILKTEGGGYIEAEGMEKTYQMTQKKMKNTIYMAPMEGLTDFTFRNAYEKIFGKGKIAKYFTPFISPNKSEKFLAREIRDIDREHNNGINTVGIYDDSSKSQQEKVKSVSTIYIKDWTQEKQLISDMNL